MCGLSEVEDRKACAGTIATPSKQQPKPHTANNLRRDLWLPGDNPQTSPSRFRATNLMMSTMTQESYIRVRSQTLALNPGRYFIRILAERGAPRATVSLVAAPSDVRLAAEDREALETIVADCCTEAERAAMGPCMTLSDAIAAAVRTDTPAAAPDSICHAGATLCDPNGHLHELILRNPDQAVEGLSCPKLSAGFAALPALERLDIDGSSLRAGTADVAAALAPSKTLKWLVLRRAGLTGALPCELLSSSRLVVVDVSGNDIEGDLPGCYLENEHLVQLYVGNNRLSGDLPPFGATSVVRFFNVHCPPLSGLLLGGWSRAGG